MLAVLALAGLLGACRGGYPNEDQVLPSPFDMDLAQRLEVLNGLGHAARGDAPQRWTYALEPGCRLLVKQRRKGLRAASPEVFELSRQMDVTLSFDESSQTFGVYLMSGGDPARAKQLGLLFSSSAWTDAAQVDLLLQLLIRDCGGAAAASDRARPLGSDRVGA
ncbi:hypothetical protein [Roseateles sp.]|jgi:hypothetical protein|uniref:hypothetical protein n=1 Tax=Roseateles sp. TaxID=1971397 RepID=UPI00391D9A80